MNYISKFSSLLRGLSFTAPLVVLAIASSAHAANVNFTDNFTPTASPLWNNYAGNWTASGGQYYAQTPSDNPFTISALPFDMTN